MKEIEILVEVFQNFEETKKALDKFVFVGKKNTVDEYFYDSLRENLKPDEELRLRECFRVRQKGDNSYITYKIDHFDIDDKWIYSDEYETKIESKDDFLKIVKCLGLQKLITIDSEKYVYMDENYEIVLEKVKDLGVFLEVELKQDEDITDVNEEKNKIQNYIESLNIPVSEELNMGKPEMMIRKQYK